MQRPRETAPPHEDAAIVAPIRPPMPTADPRTPTPVSRAEEVEREHDGDRSSALR
jgi:hypothetical protein